MTSISKITTITLFNIDIYRENSLQTSNTPVINYTSFGNQTYSVGRPYVIVLVF